jgi:dimethylhistidine N-methyltransferase
MSFENNKQITFYDFKPAQDRFRDDVVNGLQKQQKELPCKYLYDERGSYLFECICGLDEYYIPNTETVIMKTAIRQIAELLGPDVLLIEYGSGSSAKTHILLDHLSDLTAYMPIDISREQLMEATEGLARKYPRLTILPVCADYTSEFNLPGVKVPVSRPVAYFPGSTIGNLSPNEARQLLAHIAGLCGPGGGLLIGVDLKKDPAILHSAYNDSDGITALFNLNILERINRELDGKFHIASFEHYAFYNPQESRVEMHLISRQDQKVHLDSTSVSFTRGESIWTESSYKYNLDEFARLAAGAGFSLEHVWTDEQHLFSVQYLVYKG